MLSSSDGCLRDFAPGDVFGFDIRFSTELEMVWVCVCVRARAFVCVTQTLFPVEAVHAASRSGRAPGLRLGN